MWLCPDTSVRVVRVAPGVDARAMGDELAGLNKSGLKPFKDAPGGTVAPALLGSNTRVVVKNQPLIGLRQRSGAWTASTRGLRAWRSARWLLDNGFQTAEPLLLLRGTRDGRTIETLVCRRLDGPTLLETIHAGASPETARLVGDQLARLVSAGRYNRDHKPSNLIVTNPAKPPAIVDTVAIRPAPFRARALVRMLAALASEPTGLGFAPSAALCLRTTRAAAGGAGDGRELFWRAQKLLLSKGDLRPRDLPAGIGA